MDNINGIPAHPLFVHIPVVLVPLVAVGVFATMVRPNWYQKYRWLLLIGGTIAVVGTFLAAEAGESLQSALPGGQTGLVHDHAEAGERSEILIFLFFLALLAYVLVPWYLNRRASNDSASAGWSSGPGWMRPTLMVIVGITAIGATFGVISAGESGAKSVWDRGAAATLTA